MTCSPRAGAAFQEEVLRRLRQRCQGYGPPDTGGSPTGLGIRLEGLSLHDMHPPQEVVGSYHEVTKAMEQRDRRVNLEETRALCRNAHSRARA